jgi:hypothetical protein
MEPMNKLSYFAPIAALLLVGTACNHYSTQEAYEVCVGLVEVPEGGDTALFDACVACFENCGDDCEHPRTDQFTCPGQEDDPGTGGAGGS